MQSSGSDEICHDSALASDSSSGLVVAQVDREGWPGAAVRSTVRLILGLCRWVLVSCGCASCAGGLGGFQASSLALRSQKKADGTWRVIICKVEGS